MCFLIHSFWYIWGESSAGPARNKRRYTGLNLNLTQPPLTWSPSHVEKAETILFLWRPHTGTAGFEAGTHAWLARQSPNHLLFSFCHWLKTVYLAKRRCWHLYCGYQYWRLQACPVTVDMPVTGTPRVSLPDRDPPATRPVSISRRRGGSRGPFVHQTDGEEGSHRIFDPIKYLDRCGIKNTRVWIYRGDSFHVSMRVLFIWRKASNWHRLMSIPADETDLFYWWSGRLTVTLKRTKQSIDLHSVKIIWYIL